MPKGEYEKSIRISDKPAKKQGIKTSFVDGAKQSAVKTPKSLTPMPRSSPHQRTRKK